MRISENQQLDQTLKSGREQVPDSFQAAWQRQMQQADLVLLDGIQLVQATALHQAVPAMSADYVVQGQRLGGAQHDRQPDSMLTAGLQETQEKLGLEPSSQISSPDDSAGARAAKTAEQLNAVPGRTDVVGMSKPEISAAISEPATEVQQGDPGLEMAPRAVNPMPVTAAGVVALASRLDPVLAAQENGIAPLLLAGRNVFLAQAGGPMSNGWLVEVPQEAPVTTGKKPQTPSDSLKPQHMHLIEDEAGQVRLWLRDSGLGEAQQGAVLQRIQQELLRSGQVLSQVMVNGKPVKTPVESHVPVRREAGEGELPSADMHMNHSGLYGLYRLQGA
ncbi:hypothetical protein SAMN02745857_02934 [Andreprevotia lacus DSM 23236]|jgi:hypothetical protein|uniref:Uncharacterized protein n=1 Tax=Andreprevotia lacus DSM 23236 TaxID=1121001 RepID=A0A1W1XUY3_9NEIS|nr:hypothetical protein [Andreprevotia lacus]SMC27675.1 hypothetical protein SAMN02745857_02934 [Andreprevotia lacus DSM 23236]